MSTTGSRSRSAASRLARRAAWVVALAAACRREPTVSLRVAACGDLRAAFDELGAGFARAEAVAVTFAFGAPEALLERAPADGAFDLFVSADPAPVGRLVASGRCDDATRSVLGYGGLAVVAARSVARPAALADLAEPRFARVVIADPERDPYGRAAVQVLAGTGLYERLGGRVARVESAEQALREVRSGAAQAALVPRSMVADEAALAVPQDLHRPVELLAVVCTRDAARRDAALRFLSYAHDGEGQRAMERRGVVAP